MKLSLFFLFILSVSAQTLHYSINWPSGLSLGEATISSQQNVSGLSVPGGPPPPTLWTTSMDIDASVPGFAVRDHYKSTASGSDVCSTEFDKDFTHGHHKSQERITFNQHDHRATRQTLNGGKSDFEISPCARDPLAFIQYVRNELANGRVPPAQQVVYGAIYNVRLEYTGEQNIKLGEETKDSDRVVATIKGPSSNVTVELFFSRDAARVPLLARLPLSLGTFTVELTQ